jgi:hypothetical protein
VPSRASPRRRAPSAGSLRSRRATGARPRSRGAAPPRRQTAWARRRPSTARPVSLSIAEGISSSLNTSEIVFAAFHRSAPSTQSRAAPQGGLMASARAQNLIISWASPRSMMGTSPLQTIKMAESASFRPQARCQRSRDRVRPQASMGPGRRRHSVTPAVSCNGLMATSPSQIIRATAFAR